MLQAARRLRADNQVHDAAPDSALAATVVAMRSAAADIMIVAGVDADQAMQAIQRDDADLDMPTPAPTPRGPFHGLRLPWKRREK